MVDQFITTYRRLIQSVNYEHRRYLYQHFHTQNRSTGLIGPRGTGKTTLLLQYIQEKIPNKEECIYLSADHIYFTQNTLLDLIRTLYEEHGVRYFFLDEIHKYKKWNQELKNAYDSYPDIKIVFSGSSSIDLIKGSYDLSRRGVLFRLNGMSFREYLLFQGIPGAKPTTLANLLENHRAMEDTHSPIMKLKGLFKDYLSRGYYPFFLEDEDTYHQKLLRVIDKTIYEDISNYYKLKTENLFYFRKLLSYLSVIPPGELNRNSLSRNIGLDNKTIDHYLSILKETGMAELITENKSGSSLLKSTEKIYLDNANLYTAIAQEIGRPPQTGTIREIFFVKMLQNAGNPITYTKNGDFESRGTIFEIRGPNKDARQIRNNPLPSYLVKDGLLYGSKNQIPLYLFGFLY